MQPKNLPTLQGFKQTQLHMQRGSKNKPIRVVLLEPSWDDSKQIYTWDKLFQSKPSSLPGAGLGLFAKKRLDVGMAIPYLGCLIQADIFNELEAMECGPRVDYCVEYKHWLISAHPTLDGKFVENLAAASLANEATDGRPNCQIFHGCLVVVSAIQPGTELLTFYGRRFWRKFQYTITEPTNLKRMSNEPDREGWKKKFHITEPIITDLRKAKKIVGEGKVPPPFYAIDDFASALQGRFCTNCLDALAARHSAVQILGHWYLCDSKARHLAQNTLPDLWLYQQAKKQSNRDVKTLFRMLTSHPKEGNGPLGSVAALLAAHGGQRNMEKKADQAIHWSVLLEVLATWLQSPPRSEPRENVALQQVTKRLEAAKLLDKDVARIPSLAGDWDVAFQILDNGWYKDEEYGRSATHQATLGVLHDLYVLWKLGKSSHV